jgi:hypothetical protein
MRLNSGSPSRRRGRHQPENKSWRYCFDAVQRPAHPSDCRNVPEPPRPESRPTLLTVMPLELPTALAEPLALTCPLTPSPKFCRCLQPPPSLLPEQGVPIPTTTQAPSKLPPPPPPREADRRVCSTSGLLHFPDRSGSAGCGAGREPDRDFSSLPILPPALPDCASAVLGPIKTASEMQRRTTFVRVRMTFCINTWFQLGCSNPSGRTRRHRRRR